MNDVMISKNFSLKEFECPCCHTVMIRPELIRLLQKLRDKLDRMVIITSGYRCKEHNRKVGGEVGSYHLYGMAADICVPDFPVEILAKEAEQVGFGGIGLYKDKVFIHVDIGPKRRWTK
ncbi:MAG: D-Ala-D-Ala carboxypeptidase family metallohydrolase [Candidatus Micrarchaeaceae archaeon]